MAFAVERDWYDWSLFAAAFVAAFGAVWGVWLMTAAMRRARTSAVAGDITATAQVPNRIEIIGYVWVASTGTSLQRFEVSVHSNGKLAWQGTPAGIPQTYHGLNRVQWLIHVDDVGQQRVTVDLQVEFADRGSLREERTVDVAR